MSKRDMVGPFRVAFGGIIHTFRTQRHMRIHLYVTFATILAAMFFRLRLREILVLLFMITFVLVAEMFNSAIEATVDLASPNYHPLAKFAKDIAAGAVLITTIMAIIVGSLIAIGEGQWERIRVSIASESIGLDTVSRIIAGVFLTVIVVIIGKGLGSRGRVLQGGLVSGHAAIGFFLATSALLLADNVVVGGVAIILAAIIAQSRWEAKFHSIFELTLGAAVGVILGVVLFGIIPK
ncbi:MAG: diacylglycerol kinase [Fimbriimonadaceae bacterium]|nr:MAG: diacylglycerol kinase [Fimbriimonadaceae bacterium]